MYSKVGHMAERGETIVDVNGDRGFWSLDLCKSEPTVYKMHESVGRCTFASTCLE